MAHRICVVGTGYVGLASMIGLAELGWGVNGYDILPERIERLRRGIAPFRESGIETSLHKHLDAGRLRFFDSLADAAKHSELVILAVGTPANEDGSADLTYLHSAISSLSSVNFETRPTLAIRCTVPPGTTEALARSVEPWAELIYAPEFLREASAVYDFLNPDRIIVGTASVAVAVPYVRLFEAIEKPVIFTSRCNAELIKCCSNAFLALKISFANEVANLCDAVGATADDVLRGIGYDRRIGFDFLRPGIGFGGPCLEKDVRSIAQVTASHGCGGELFTATLRVNGAQLRRIVDVLQRELGDLDGTRIGVWGLAFKAGTDDIRDSLALRIIDHLAQRDAMTLVYDPAVHIAPLPRGSQLVPSALEATDADALVVLTDWPEFRRIDPAQIAARLRGGIVVDGCNILDSERIAAAGLRYKGVGRAASPTTEAPQLVSGL